MSRSLPQTVASRCRAISWSRLVTVFRAPSLDLLFLLPMQMRAGAADPHPHAMLQLLIDARDGALDHHEDDHAAEPAGHGSAGGAHEPDLPKAEASNVAVGAMAMLAALVVTLLSPAALRVTIWPTLPSWSGWLPAIVPPPPRTGVARPTLDSAKPRGQRRGARWRIRIMRRITSFLAVD